MADREEQQFKDFLNSLKTEEAVPSARFKDKLKNQVIREFNKGNSSGYSIADWYLNFLSLVLVIISISLVAYFGVLYNTNTGRQNGSTVVLSDNDKTRILANYAKNNPETLTNRRETPVVSNPIDQKSSNYFIIRKNQTFSNQYFRCTGSFLITNQDIVEETHYTNGETAVKEIIKNGVGDLISEKVISYVGRITQQMEYRGGKYIGLFFSNDQPRSGSTITPTSISQVSKNGKDYYEIEYRSFYDCKGEQQQLITLQYADINTYKVEIEEVYLDTESQENLYSISSIVSEERNISSSEKTSIFRISEDAPQLVVNNTDLANSLLKILVPEDSFIEPLNGRTDAKTVNHIDRNFYPQGSWGNELFEYTLLQLGNPSLKYDLQLSPFEYTTVSVTGIEEIQPTGGIDSTITIDGTRTNVKVYSINPVSSSVGNNQVIFFKHNNAFYKVETSDISLFRDLVRFNK